MNEFLDLRIDTVHYRGTRGGVILSGNCMLSNDRYIASINRDELLDLPIIRSGKIWRLWGVEKECELQFPNKNILETMIYVTKAQDLSSTYENLVNFIIDEDKISLSESRQLLELLDDDLINVIANRNIDVLVEVLSEKIALLLCDTFSNASNAEASRFLDRFGLPQHTIKKIVAMYGSSTIKKIVEDPYRLLSFGVAWAEVDLFATTYCYIDNKSELRLHASVEEALYRACEDGSTAIKLKDLRTVLYTVLNDMPLVHKALSLKKSNGQYHNVDSFYYPSGAWLIEQRISEWVVENIVNPPSALFSSDELKAVISSFHTSDGLKLSSTQKKALQLASASRFSLWVGANGVGKTTLIECLCRGTLDVHVTTPVYRIALSGVVVSGMKEIAGCLNHTLSSFIKHARRYTIKENALIILEEADMVDNVSFYRLINCLPKQCKVILVGDDRQLAPLGVGSVLHALSSINVPKVMLKDQYQPSDIGSIAHVLQAARKGIWRGIKAYSDGFEGVGFVSCSNSDIDHNVLELYKRLSEEESTQVICPTQSGSGGADTLNMLIQPQANMSLDELTYVDKEFGLMSYQSSTGAFTVGDKVVYTKNSDSNELRDGSLGVIIQKLIPTKASSPICKIDFGVDGIHNFKAEELENLEMAYAITAHRAQGYQFKNVIIPIRQSRSLERALLYMAISLGTERVILVGNREAAINAVEKVSVSTRSVGLTRLITESV